MVWMTQSQMQTSMRRPQFNMTDDEFNWYKPVAVILKPASKRDLQQRLLQVNVDEFLLPSYQSSLLPPWPFVQDYSAFRRWINYQSSDRLRDVYRRYELLAGHVERRLTSLARMGLVAIPKVTKINRQRSGNNRNQEQQMPEQRKKGKDKLPPPWLYELVGPPGPAGKDGVNGIHGINGVDGKDGRDGIPGAIGQPGPQGLKVLPEYLVLKEFKGRKAHKGATERMVPMERTGRMGLLALLGGHQDRMQKTEEMDQLDHPAHQVNQELPDKMGRMELTGKMVKTEVRVHLVLLEKTAKMEGPERMAKMIKMDR
ncbi:uncharacterized protein LOC124311810 isoform X2 [Daphnia pulicaria]|uniref:uncharacterized protein LOC124311810 isoform X2 n=1 Tax=Daphnia pulicaria TaxID=35523 RepID=UPI001EE9D09F|nr:uncharacterized protein LOC124311810 isoform X2 [Daphnia pulicaria]